MTADERDQPDARQGDPAKGKAATQDKPKLKNQRPSFEMFVHMLSETLSGGSTKNQLSAVLRLLKRGFDGEVRPEQANKVFDLIKGCSWADRLSVQLTAAHPQKPSGIARAVLNRLRSCFSELTGYPPEQGDKDRLLDLTDWIVAGSQKQNQPETTRFPAEWIRMAFTCLASERDTFVRCRAVYHLLSTIARTGKRDRSGPFSPDSQNFVHEAAQLVSAKAISPRKVAAALQFAHPMEERARQQEAAARDARNASLEATQKARTLAEENTQLRQQLQTALAHTNELRQQSERLAVQVSTEQERTRELEKFWEKRSEQELARQRHQISTALAHDLQEACLALDRETPNAAMALNRVRAAHESIRSLGQAR